MIKIDDDDDDDDDNNNNNNSNNNVSVQNSFIYELQLFVFFTEVTKGVFH